MNIDILQHNESSINAVYLYKDFLSEEELSFVTNALDELTKKDQSQKYKTNVHAKMTGWVAILQEPKFHFLLKKIMDTISITYKLRSPNPSIPLRTKIYECWGMRHSLGDHTAHHIHCLNGFSGGFYARVPTTDTIMGFPDFRDACTLQSNSLIFFLASVKHSVSKHTSNEDRLSLAFNATIEEIKND